MAGHKINFTRASVNQLPAALAGKRVTWHDSQISGLQISVTDKGSKSFFVRRKVRGRSERFHLGRYPDLTIEQARRRAQETIGQVASGRQAADIRGNRSAHAMLGQLFDLYIESYAKPHKKTWKLDAAQFRLYLVKLRGRRLDSISREEIVKLHAAIGSDHGQYAANRLLSLLSKLFNFAIEMKLLTVANPVAGIRRFRERARERFLRPEELPRFVKALEQEPNATARDFFWIALLTGQRMSNVLGMRWAEIDLVRAEWRIPETKNGTLHTVPLPSQAMAILVIRRQMESGCPPIQSFGVPQFQPLGPLTESGLDFDCLPLRSCDAR
jgi:Arm DNA-binding domain/Phage integrase family